MPYSRRERIGMYLQRFTVLHPVLLRYDGQHAGRTRYTNRLNGHAVMKGGA